MSTVELRFSENDFEWMISVLQGQDAVLVTRSFTFNDHVTVYVQSVKSKDDQLSYIEQQGAIEVRAVELQTEFVCSKQYQGLLCIGIGNTIGWWQGFYIHQNSLKLGAVDRISLIGDSIRYLYPERTEPAMDLNSEWERNPRMLAEIGDWESWRSIQHTTVAFIGCGKIGSEVAGDLARQGLLKDVILIDPGMIEDDDITSCTLYTDEGVGKCKVTVLAESLSKDQIEVTEYPFSINDDIVAVQRAPLWVVTADNDEARFNARRRAKACGAAVIELMTSKEGKIDCTVYHPNDRINMVQPAGNTELLWWAKNKARLPGVIKQAIGILECAIIDFLCGKL